MEAADSVGLRQDEDIVVAAEVALLLLEALATELGLGKTEHLDKCAHRAVEHEDTLGGGSANGGFNVRAGDHGRPSMNSSRFPKGSRAWKRPGPIASARVTSMPLAASAPASASISATTSPGWA